MAGLLTGSRSLGQLTGWACFSKHYIHLAAHKCHAGLAVVPLGTTLVRPFALLQAARPHSALCSARRLRQSVARQQVASERGTKLNKQPSAHRLSTSLSTTGSVVLVCCPAQGQQSGNTAEQAVSRSQQVAGRFSRSLLQHHTAGLTSLCGHSPANYARLAPPFARELLCSRCAARQLLWASLHAVPPPVAAHLGHGHPHTSHGACTAHLQEGSGVFGPHVCCAPGAWPPALLTCRQRRSRTWVAVRLGHCHPHWGTLLACLLQQTVTHACLPAEVCLLCFLAHGIAAVLQMCNLQQRQHTPEPYNGCPI